MADSPPSVPGAFAAPSPQQSFNQALESAMTCVRNLKWDEAEIYVGHMASAAAQLPEDETILGTAFLKPVAEFVTGNRLLAEAKSDADRSAALAHLQSAQSAVRDCRAQIPAMAGNPGYFQFALGIETQVYTVHARLARAQGDMAGATQWQMKADQTFDDMLKTLAEDDPQRCYLLACRKLPFGANRLERGMQAAAEMNLDQARVYLREARTAFEEIRVLYARVKERSGTVEGMAKLGEGLRLFSGALDAYITALHTGVVGDLTRAHLNRLAVAERAAVEGAEAVTQATASMPGFFAEIDLRQNGQALAVLSRNLRALGERSLTPKALSQSASPRAVVYFLGTFVVLALALPYSGLIERLDFTGVGFLLVISLVVALIGAFGFESTRLLPWFDALAKFFPGAGGKDDAKDGDEEK